MVGGDDDCGGRAAANVAGELEGQFGGGGCKCDGLDKPTRRLPTAVEGEIVKGIVMVVDGADSELSIAYRVSTNL